MMESLRLIMNSFYCFFGIPAFRRNHALGRGESKEGDHSIALYELEGLFSQVIAQFPADGRMPQAAQCLGFDLADALAGYAHLASNFF